MSKRSVEIIAHRGASGYLPEHTLAAKAYAHALGADYIEQDIVATRDDELVVMHDIHLDRVTNVAERFPDRHREDGRYYVRDFDLHEIGQLSAFERRRSDGATAVYPGRYPTGVGHFGVPTLREEVRFIQGMNRATGREVGIYPEIKRPRWHRDEGIDISRQVLQLLDDLGYRNKTDACYLQCFDATEVRRIRHDLGCRLKLVQLIADNAWGESATDYDELRTAAGLDRLAATVDGIGPWIGHLASVNEIDGQPVSTGLASAAHAHGLLVHAYTFRADELAPGFDSMPEMVRWFVDEVKLDGVFSDFPDLAIAGLAV